MDLNVVYSKTPKGLRARPSLIGGLSSQLMKVLAHIDGATKAEIILQKHDELTEKAFAAALTQLEKDGYIKAVSVAESSDEEWALTTNFMPMEVEEFQGTISAVSTEDEEAQAESQAKLQADLKAKVKEEARLQAEAKAREKEEQALAKAEEKAQLEAERKAKAEADASKKAELKAADAAEENRAKAQAEAKEKAKREIERMKLEAAEAKQHADAEAKIEAQLKAESERKAETEAAERKKIELEAAAAAESARAKLEAAEAAEENARRENERVAREAEAAQKQAELEARANAEEAARLEAQREAEAKRASEAAEEARLQEEARLEYERKAKAEEVARLEAEREAEAQAEAEKLRAKAEAEEQAKLVEQAKAEEQERARQDIARIVREAEEARRKSEEEAKEARQSAKEKEKAEEAQKKAEAEAIAKAELEAKQEAERQANALVEAQLKAETKLKALEEQNRLDAEATEKASTDANLKASLAMQSFAIEAPEAEVKAEAALSAPTEQKPKSAAARLKAELKAKVDAEQRVLAAYNAEQKALADEKEVARQEMERISREAEVERQKQAPSASLNVNASANLVDELSSRPDTSPSTDAVEVRWENDDERDFEEERIAEEVEKVGTEIKKKAKRVAEVEGREGIIRGAKEEALLKAKIKRYDGRIALINAMSKLSALIRKSLLFYLPPAILLILALLHIVNISPLVAPIEKLATESFGAPVKIEEVRASLWPRPHLVLKNVLIGAESGQKIDELNIVPATSTLYDEIKTLRSLEISGLKIAPENFALPQHWINSLAKAPHLKVEQIKLSKMVLQIRDFESAPLKGNVVLNESRALKSLDLKTEDDTLAIQITPQGSNFDVALTGTNFALPMNPKFVFNELKATGNMNQNQILFSALEGTIYSGSFTGKAALDWSSQWSVAGNFKLNKAMAQEMLAAFNSSALIDGRLNLNGTFSSKSDQAAKLADALDLSASFDVQNGKIKGVELERAVLSKGAQSLAGDATRFDRLTGSVKIRNGNYQYRQLALKGDQFRASGNVDIKPNQDISGNISADLSAQSRSLQAQFDLAGTVNSVKRQ